MEQSVQTFQQIYKAVRALTNAGFPERQAIELLLAQRKQAAMPEATYVYAVTCRCDGSVIGIYKTAAIAEARRARASYPDDLHTVEHRVQEND